jgi:hypothetical protein
MADQDLQHQVFEYIKQTAEKIGDFASKEIPPFINEFLQWKFIEAGIYSGCWALIFLICFVAGIFVIKWKKQIGRAFSNTDGITIFFFFFWLSFCIILIATFVPVFLSNILTMVQIHVAPKVYLIEQAANYLK